MKCLRPALFPLVHQLPGTSSRGHRQVQLNKSALYRENMHLHSELLKYNRKAEKYKKRRSRMKQSRGRIVANSKPRRTTEALLRSGNCDTQNPDISQCS